MGSTSRGNVRAQGVDPWPRKWLGTLGKVDLGREEDVRVNAMGRNKRAGTRLPSGTEKG